MVVSLGLSIDPEQSQSMSIRKVGECGIVLLGACQDKNRLIFIRSDESVAANFAEFHPFGSEHPFERGNHIMIYWVCSSMQLTLSGLTIIFSVKFNL